MSSGIKNKGWSVTMAGLGINLALGILYTWSIFKAAIEGSIKAKDAAWASWDMASANDPYAVCCIIFAVAMVFAGRMQDKMGPRLTASIGGLLVGIGFIVISQSTSYAIWVLGFGVLAGAGIGFGYASATPPAVKWFPKSKTGMIAGLVVAGFGLASVYIAPLSTYLLKAFGLQMAMMIFGIAFTIVVCGLATLLVNPPAGYSPETVKPAPAGQAPKSAAADINLGPMDAMKTGTFYRLWITFFISCGAGLVVIGSIAGMAKASLGTWAFLAVAVLAIGNAGGRILAGMISDKIGRQLTLIIMLFFQASLMFLAVPILKFKFGGAAVLVILTALIGANYGANLSIFPSAAKDQWGLKNFGINYGVLFSAWGFAGLIFPRISQMLVAKTATFDSSLYMCCATLLAVGIFNVFSLKARRKTSTALQTA
ncbi:MAG: OFA family MFS transporter [Deltaproteobacteria bacterium]|nr:OFA family MFS transporter [Deltaproteobacteria bacterium]